METEKIGEIAFLLEEIGNTKITLTEVILGRELSVEERDDLYFSAIKDNLGLIFKHCPKISTLALANALQVKEMFGCHHIYFVGKDQHLDRYPTESEIREHYINDRAIRFRKHFDEIMEAELSKKQNESKQSELTTI